MQKGLYFLLMIIGFYGCSRKTLQTDWVKANLKGNVMSVKEYSYKAVVKFGEVEKGGPGELNIDQTFNKDGYLIEVNDYLNGTLFQKTKYSYSNDHKLERVELYNSAGGLQVLQKFEYTDSKTVLSRSYNAEGALLMSHRELIDKAGNIIEYSDSIPTSPYSSQLNLPSVVKQQFNSNNQITAITRYNTQNEIISEEKNKYDGGVLIEKWISDGFTIKYTNDKIGNQIEAISQGSQGTTTLKTSYKYDSHQNWIEKTVLFNGEPHQITQRIIEYY